MVINIVLVCVGVKSNNNIYECKISSLCLDDLLMILKTMKYLHTQSKYIHTGDALRYHVHNKKMFISLS